MQDRRQPDFLCCEPLSPTRRAILGAAGALFASAFVPRIAQAAGNRDPRFVCIVLRGALDGLAAVPPIGDPAYGALHGDMALRLDGQHPAFPLDGFFALHPAMPNLARLYKAKQATVIHAVASPYRARSHFDGQDVLESGYAGVGKVDSGWLNRLIGALPAGERIAPHGALGVGAIPPLVVRGQAPVIGWAPAVIAPAGDDLARRVLDLYAERDAALSAALAKGVEAEKLAGSQGGEMGQGGGMGQKTRAPSHPDGMRQVAEGAARLVVADDGPRIAALALEGWDTHANEGGATGQLATRLAGLDGAIATFERILGDKWKDTALMIVTEFGRTARVNGTAGTDHGTGTVCFLAGGAIRGGRILADWPGLGERALYEGRDLKPTTDLRAVAKGILADLFGASETVLGGTVFPESGAVKPIKDLVV